MDCIIKTKDKQTADCLRASGCLELSNTNGVWTFANTGKANFSEEIKSNIVFDNRLTF